MDLPKGYANFLFGEQLLSTNNGVGSALAANAAFESEPFDCGRFSGALPGVNALPNAGRNAPSTVRIAASSDQTGTLSLQHSADKVNWFTDSTVKDVAVPADFTVLTVQEAKVALRYVRVVLTNGATAQTEVELDVAFVSI